MAPVRAAPLVVVAVISALLVPGVPAHAQAAVPAQPTGLSVSASTHDSVTLAWDDPADASITGYQVLRRSRDASRYGDGEGAAEFVAVVDDTGSATTSYADASVTPHTRYVYRIKARNIAGLSERSNYVNAETPEAPVVPSMPAGLAVSSVSRDGVTLVWDDPGDATIEGYQVLRRTRDGSEYAVSRGPADFVVIVDDTGSPAAAYTDTAVTPGPRYVYRIKARNIAGLSERSSFVSAEIPKVPGVPSMPSMPAGLAVSSVSRDGVTLVWDDPGDETIEGYQVLRRARDGSEYGDGRGPADSVVVVDDTGSPAAAYTDTSVTARTRYVYRIKARNTEGLSERSNYVNAETPEAPGRRSRS